MFSQCCRIVRIIVVMCELRLHVAMQRGMFVLAVLSVCSCITFLRISLWIKWEVICDYTPIAELFSLLIIVLVEASSNWSNSIVFCSYFLSLFSTEYAQLLENVFFCLSFICFLLVTLAQLAFCHWVCCSFLPLYLRFYCMFKIMCIYVICLWFSHEYVWRCTNVFWLNHQLMIRHVVVFSICNALIFSKVFCSRQQYVPLIRSQHGAIQSLIDDGIAICHMSQFRFKVKVMRPSKLEIRPYLTFGADAC